MALRRLCGRAVGCVAATLLVFAGCGDSMSKPDPSFFTIRPVTRQLAPPCAAPALSALAGGQAVRCYELGPVGVDAGDVTSAVGTNRAEGAEVSFNLSPQGSDRFNAMARAAGVGSQVAIVVDGVVVSVPRLDTTEFAGRGVVTGLDADAAARLAKRLNRG